MAKGPIQADGKHAPEAPYIVQTPEPTAAEATATEAVAAHVHCDVCGLPMARPKGPYRRIRIARGPRWRCENCKTRGFTGVLIPRAQ